MKTGNLNSNKSTLRTASKMTRKRHNPGKILTNAAKRHKMYRQSKEEQHCKDNRLNKRYKEIVFGVKRPLLLT